MIILSAAGMESRQLVAPRARPSACLKQVYFFPPGQRGLREAVNEIRRWQGRLLAPPASGPGRRRHRHSGLLQFRGPRVRGRGKPPLRAGADPQSLHRPDVHRGRGELPGGRGTGQVQPGHPDFCAGKRVVAVDDSIVRGTTSRKLVDLLFKAGATEVHFRVASPPSPIPATTASTPPPRRAHRPTSTTWRGSAASSGPPPSVSSPGKTWRPA